MNDIANNAWQQATTWVTEHPLPSDTEGTVIERTAFHALMNILDDKISRDERDAIINVWVKATMAEHDRGWSRGWDRAKNAYTKEVAA